MQPDDLKIDQMHDVIMNVLDRPDTRTSPWARRLGAGERGDAYRHLARQLGERYRHCTFDTYQIYDNSKRALTQASALDQVKSWADDMESHVTRGGGLVLFGPPGTGKDHLLACAGYWAIIRFGFSVTWRDGAQLAQRLRESIREGGEGRIVDELSNAQILILSDPVPPKGDTSAWIVDVLQRIIDRRYRNGLSTWASLNVKDGKEAEQRLAPPIVDRLRHGSLALNCTWKSYRK